MTDRELLELAAKAAGIDGIYDTDFDMLMLLDSAVVPTMWNPLKSDGDALRLAVKLKIDLEWQATCAFPEPHVEAYQRNAEGSCFCASEHEDDYRRAIVRAAAEIGRTMP